MTILHVSREGWKVTAEGVTVTVPTGGGAVGVVVTFNELKGITKLISANVVKTDPYANAYEAQSPDIKGNVLGLTLSADAPTDLTADIVVQGY